MSSTTTFVGLDIGASNIHVALSHDKTTPVHFISLEDLDWFEQLEAIIPPNAVICLEPTGWHYSAAIIAALQHIGATVRVVEHRITGKVREMKVSGVKNDKTDAKALCYIAEWSSRESLIGVHPAHPVEERAAAGLRLLIYSYMRSTKETTRSTNRLRQLARSIWPILGQKITTYLGAVKVGYITAPELHDLAMWLRANTPNEIRDDPYLSGYAHATRRAELLHIADAIPNFVDGAELRTAIEQEAQRLETFEDQAAFLYTRIESAAQGEPFAALTTAWCSIPGVTPLLCGALHAATHGNAARMSNAQFRAVVGFHPRKSQSGETAESAAARAGFKPAKAMLHLATMRLIQQGNNPIAATFQVRKVSGGESAIQVARAKLIRILSSVARSGQPYQEEPHVR